MPPAGYTQIPRNALYVRNSDGSGPYYLSAAGVMTAFSFPVGGGGGASSGELDFGVASQSGLWALFEDI
jgi:hypothetical protein